MNVRTLAAADWPTLAAFLCANNVAPALCLHSHAGSTVAAHHADLAAFASDAACFVVAEQGTGCVAVMGAEFSVECQRAWLRGPVLDVALASPLGDDVRSALWNQLSAALPAEIKRFDGFLDIAHTSRLDWYRSRGFIEQPRYFIYETKRGESAPTMPSNVHTVTASQHASLLDLAHLVFPSGYLTDSELTTVNDEQRALFVIADGDRVDGYVYANIINPTTDEAEVYVDYLVVRPEARGRKLGRTLLRAALHWGFVERGVSKAALTVAADNANAQSLYASVGFALAATGVPMQLRLD